MIQRIAFCVALCFILSLNGISQNSPEERYIFSRLYQKGDYELHFFQNYYSQSDRLNGSDDYNSRYNFNTTTLQFLGGVSNSINLGFVARIRSVNQTLQEQGSFFTALNFKNNGFESNAQGSLGYSRSGITAIGPRIKYQPFKSLESFSIQHTIFIPVGSELGGNSETGFVDWGSLVFQSQIFFDKAIGLKSNFFVETGINLENINSSLLSKAQGFHQISIPSTAIYSYFPTPETTIYGLFSYSPKWERSVGAQKEVNAFYNPFTQVGIGLKYRPNLKIEFEFIYTLFEDAVDNRSARTVNFGIRYFKQ